MIRVKLAIVALAISLEVGAVLLLAQWMKPIHEGTSAEFWRLACGVDLDGTRKDLWGGIHSPRDDWYIYYIQGYHGQFLYRVKRSAALDDYPRVLQKFEQAGSDANVTPVLRRAHAAIDREHASIDHDPDKFLSLIRQAIEDEIRSKDEQAYQYFISADEAFSERWSRIGRYWLNAVFEIAFFGGLTLFAFWPWLRSKGWRSWSLHLGLLPLLLFLPFYLGYASWTFTSAGPSGGILYPWVIIWFREFPIWTPVDQWLLEHVPKVLEPLSQTLGPWLAITGGRPLGPVAAVIIGAVIAGITWLLTSFVHHSKTRSTH